jgi:hypothetical protein
MTESDPGSDPVSEPGSVGDRWGASERLVAGVLAGFLAVVTVVGIHRPLFIDEAFSVLTASGDLSSIVERLRSDNNLPLYFFLLHWWVAIAGISEVAVRLPSVAFYLASVAVVYRAGRELGGARRFGLYAAIFFAASLQAIHLAQKVRGYSLLGLLAALSTLWFVRAFSETTAAKSAVVTFVVVNIAGTFTHVWFAFLLTAEGLCGLTFFRRSVARLTVALAASIAPFVLLWSGPLRTQLTNDASDWISPLTPWSPLGLLLEFFGGWPVGAIVVAGLIAIAAATDSRRDQPAVPPMHWLLMLFVVTITAPLLVSVWKPVYWPGRYTVIALPALTVWLALVLTARAKRVALAGFAVVLMIAAAAMHVSTRDWVIENSETLLAYADSDRRASEELIPRLTSGDTVIFTGLSRASLEYYLRRAGRSDAVNLVSYPSVNAGHLGWDDTRVGPATLEAEAAMIVERLRSGRPPQRVWVVAGRNDGANRVLAARLNAQFGPPEVFNWRGAFFSAVVAYPSSHSPLR